MRPVVIEPRSFEVRPDRRGWVVMAEGRARPLSLHEHKQHAIDLARALGKRVAARVCVIETDGSVEHVALAS